MTARGVVYGRPHESPPVVELRDVAVQYKGGDGGIVRALDGISLSFRAGELLGILGPSGCGKTTLLMIASLLERPSAGTVRLNGRDSADLMASEIRLRDFRRRHIGFVFQKANLIPFLTAAENVALPLVIDGTPAGQARGRALELLAALDVAHRADNYPARLSGGEQQRVAVARALVNNPDLLLADEPTAALDSRRGRQTMELMLSIARRRGAAVIIVTHDPRSIDLFDRIIEMEDGRVLAERCRRSPKHHDFASRLEPATSDANASP